MPVRTYRAVREGDLQRRFRVPSDTLIADLLYRMRYRHCRRNKGTRIILWKGETDDVALTARHRPLRGHRRGRHQRSLVDLGGVSRPR